MKRLMYIVFVIVLTGCHWTQSAPSYKHENGQWQVPLMTKQIPDIDTVLSYRRDRCQIKHATLKNEILQYKNLNNQAADLELFILTSCQPDRYQSLFRQQMDKLSKSPTWPESYRSLVDLIEIHIKMNDEAVSQKDKKIEQLNKTIEALTKIEQELESRER